MAAQNFFNETNGFSIYPRMALEWFGKTLYLLFLHHHFSFANGPGGSLSFVKVEAWRDAAGYGLCRLPNSLHDYHLCVDRSATVLLLPRAEKAEKVLINKCA
jgi:hypothetical protein